MKPSKIRVDSERKFRENAALHKAFSGHEPYFSLTPAGARALKKMLAEEQVVLQKVGGKCGELLGVESEVLEHFFSNVMGLGELGTRLNTETMFRFLGSASVGMDKEFGYKMVALDPEILEILATPKTMARQ